MHAEPNAGLAPAATAGSLLPSSSPHDQPEANQQAIQSTAAPLHQILDFDGVLAGDSNGNVNIYDSNGFKKKTVTWGGRRPHHTAKTQRAPLATHHVLAAASVQSTGLFY